MSRLDSSVALAAEAVCRLDDDRRLDPAVPEARTWNKKCFVPSDLFTKRKMIFYINLVR